MVSIYLHTIMKENLQNIILGISLAAPLGPSGIAVIKTGLKHGFVKAFLTGVGVTLADATYLFIVFFGLSYFIDIPIIKILIWSFGSLVLIYLGVQSIKESTQIRSFNKSEVKTSKNPFIVGYAINISNPLAVVWWVGVFGSILGASSAGISRTNSLLNSSTILIGILIWHSSMSLLTHWGKKYINSTMMKYVSVIAGLALAGFGIKFGYNAIITLI